MSCAGFTYSVLPRMQVHDEVLWLRVPIANFALVAVRITAHLGLVESHIGRLVAGLRGHGHFTVGGLVARGITRTG
jgi:hypothetical protein